MLEQRLKGCFWAFSLLLLGVNLVLYTFWVGLEYQGKYFRLVEPQRSFIYLIAIAVAFGYSLPRIRRVFQSLNTPNLWEAIRISFRFTFFLIIGYAFIYLFLKDIYVSRLFLISYLPIVFVVNTLLFRFGPSAIETFLFQEATDLNAVIFAYGPIPQELIDYVEQIRNKGINFKGYYSDYKMESTNALWLGNPKEINDQKANEKLKGIDIVYAYSVDMFDMAFRKTIDDCLAEGTRVQIYSNLSQAFVDPVKIINDASIQFIGFYEEPLQNPINRFLKRFIDLAVAIPVCLFVLPPLYLCIAIGQFFQSRGPVLFRQQRYGVNRKPFSILKFRTMKANNESSDESLQAKKGDARVYPLGAFLRRSSLDEFPQFINVIKGEMSVVGPRPHLTQHDDEFEKHFRRYRSRHFVKPGITGLAQINGFRGEIATEKSVQDRVQCDLQYIANWSIQQEIIIILKTTIQLISPPKTAY